MPWITFLFYNAVGGCVWITVMVLTGYLLGDSLGDCIHAIESEPLLVPIPVILMCAWHWSTGEKEAEDI